MEPLRDAGRLTVGPYRLVAELGRGGMGRVLLGVAPDGRLVAVKVVRSQFVEDDGFRARFRREVEASRRVSGAYTAAVVDSDADAPLPWLASVFVSGPSLGDVVSETGPLPSEAVVRLAVGLAAALGGIHHAGLIHRDLKPSNVMLAADGPRVIDFGIARATDSEGGTEITHTGWLVGSPAFMSPEQAEGHELTPSSDVFSLGAVLVQASTGRSPFAGTSAPQTLYNVVHTEPDLSLVPAELRDLVARCLSKDRSLRPTPEGIAGAFGPLTPSVRPWPDAVHARIDEQQASIIGLLGLDEAGGQLVASDTGTVVLARRTANQDLSTVTALQVPAGPAPLLSTPGAADPPADEGVGEDPAARRRPSRRTLLFGALGAGAVAATAVPLALMRTSGSPEAGGSGTLPPPTPSPSTSPPVTAGPSTSSSLTATPTPSSTPEELAYRDSFKWKTMLSALDYSPDGKFLAVGDFDGVLMLWNSTDLAVAATLGSSAVPGIDNLTAAAKFSPDGTLLASVDIFATITLWDTASRKKAATLQGDKNQKSAGFSNLAFSPDGKTLAYSGNRVITLWDVQSRSLVATLVNPIENPTYQAEGEVLSMAFAQDGRTIVASTALDQHDLLRFWDVRRGTLTTTVENAGDGVIALAVSPDGKALATVSRGEVKVWDVATRAVVETLPFTSNPVCALVFSPDGGSLAAVEQTGGVRIWSTATWNPIRGLDQAKSLDPAPFMPDSLVFSPDSKVLVGSFDYRLARWRVG
ncbi:WD40 repeat domain-containing serine/threonine protein kinase [Streptomyces sp. TLI_171]|uniref:WD40 repeat domain-containing serine/threonine protein kinase n=1 Tax=Streptomyces sp. TLI_171 TaxID=1938859 RepID=UPI000C19D3D6|nr:serine/threonine-protein kinase [Streptomyces sp. TLI_171]RKE23652.1 WD40 repeat protein [Streptomyces sp. TLI_171]